MKRALLVGIALGACALAPRAAQARVIQDSRYGYDLTWNAAIRMLHVDMGFTITERDRESGFVLFTYRDANRTSPGSLELVHAQIEGVAGTRIIVQLPSEPTYAERLIVTHLQRKLREEYGEAPTAPRPPPSASRATEGAGHGDGAASNNGGSSSGDVPREHSAGEGERREVVRSSDAREGGGATESSLRDHVRAD